MCLSAVLSRVLRNSRFFIPAAFFLALPLAAAASTEVGAIPGSFGVSNGVASYSIPIRVQPGSAGLSPHLALVYNSALGNGLAGYGWSLQGLSAISICSPTWAQNGQNLDVAFINGATSNNYCLDGMRLLRNASSDPFRKELDDFSVTTPYYSGGAGPVPTSGPQYFTVRTQDGLTYTYGKTADSEVVAVGPGIAAGTTMVRAFALNSVSDKYGNSIDYTYQQDTTNGDYWPVSITFTDHNGAIGTHKVVFKYTALSNGLLWTSYLAGALISQTQRLNEIDVDENGVQQFTYSLGYQATLTDANGNTGTERSELVSVQECAAATGTCLPQTTIGWQNGTSGWGGANPVNMGSFAVQDADHAAVMQFIDLNGDGRPDIIYPGSSTWIAMINNGNGFNAPVSTGYPVDATYYKDILIIDFYGDGRQELLIPKANPAGRLDWYLITPSVNGGNVSLSDTGGDTGDPAVGFGGNATVMDMNGDGLQDIVYSDGTNLNWYENMGGSLSNGAVVTAGEFSGGTQDIVQYRDSFAGATPDFDGTGRGSYMIYSETIINPGCTPDYCPPPRPAIPTWNMLEGGGYNSGPVAMAGITGSGGNLVTPLFVDFNGDGLSDALYADGSAVDGSNWTWRRYLATGASLSGGDTGIGWQSSMMRDTIAVDYSGNGRQEALLRLIDASGVCTGLGLVGYQNGQFQGGYSIGMSSEGACSSGYYLGSLRAPDLRGIGLQDLVWVANGTIYYALHNGGRPDLVTSITNNFNQTYNVAYASLVAGASYSAGTGSSATMSFPGVGGNAVAPETRNVVGPMYVVDHYIANDGTVGGTHKVTESYSGAMSDVLGHGFLGFASITTTDAYTSGLATPVTLTSVSNYDQLFPLTGRAISSAISINGNTEQSVSTTWTNVQSYPSSTYVYASTSQSSTYALGASSPYLTTTTVTTPTLSGSPGYAISAVDSVTTTSPTSIKTESVTNFATDTTNWCFALPSSSSVTNTDQSTNISLTRGVTYTNDTIHCQTSSSTQSVVDNGVTQSLQDTNTYDQTYGVLTGETLTATSAGVPATYSTSYGYDPSETFVTSVTNAIGQRSTLSWDPVLGVRLSGTDPNGVVTSATYDPFGRLQTSTAGDGTSVGQVYCLPANGCTPGTGAYSVAVTHYSNTGVAGAVMTTAFDSFFRPVHQSSFTLGGSQTNVDMTYDSLGRTVSVSTPYTGSPTTYTVTTYDLFNRPVFVYTPAGQDSGCSVAPPSPYQTELTCEVTNQYNQGTGLQKGFITNTTDPAGKQSSALLNPAGELVTETDALLTSDQAQTQYSYDPFGDLVQTIDANGNTTSMSYDTWGRKLSMTDPNMGQWQYTYDPRGLLQTQIDPKGQTVSMSYDALGRLTSRTIPVGAGTGTDTWTYDGPGGTATAPFIGKPYGLTGADGYGRLYQYDSAGRPDEVDTTIAGTTYATNTSYDTFGRVASITYPASPTPLADDPPVAVASTSSNTGNVGQTITLSGTSSYDPDNGPQPLTYTWTQTSAPPNSGTPLSANTSTVNFSNTVAGTYTFTLTVSDSVLTSSATVTVILSPLAITNLSASAVDPYTGNLSLSWTNPTGAGSNYVEQSTNGGAFSPLPGTFSNPAPITALANGNYQFAVQTCANGACDAWSSPVSVTSTRAPAVPTAPTFTPNPTTSGSFTINWVKPAGVVTLYAVYRSTDGTNYGPGTIVSSGTNLPTSESVNGTYWYKVAACNTTAACSITASPAATETVNLPVPPAPTLSANPLTVNGISQNTILSWHPNGSPAPTYYIVQFDFGGAFGSPGVLYSGAATSAVDTPQATTYYRVQSCNTAGCGPWSNAVAVTVKTCRTCSQINPIPTASNGSVSTTAGNTVSGTLAASGSGTLSFAIVAKPAHGTVTINNTTTGAFTYTPKNSYTGTDSFTFTASNSSGTSTAATESVTVNAVAAIAVPSVERLVEVSTPMQVVAPDVPGQDDVQSRLTALRERALAREQATLVRQQRDRESSDHYVDARPRGDVLFAARVESMRDLTGVRTLDPNSPGASLLSVQDAMAAGLVQPSDLAPRRLVVSGTSRFAVNYVYDSHENLSQVVNAANPSLIYWQGTASDAFGHVTTEILGNGIVTGRAYDVNTGALQGQQSGLGSGAAVANYLYKWDADGNLSSRQDVNAGLTESFTYDGLNRIKQAVTSGGASATLTVTYDPMGNIMSKSDMGTYTYSALHPMQIDHITPVSGPVRTFQYDNSNNNPGDGNLVSDGVHAYTWDALNRPTQITDSTTGAIQQFTYTPDGSRYQESTAAGGHTTSLTEVNGLFQVYVGTDAHTYDRESIMAPIGVVAIRTIRDDSQLTTRYLTTDHLGSASTITDEAGHVDGTESYDIFGQRRNPANWQTYACGSAPDNSAITDKGYTGQQELGSLCLVHMNGRVYDPQVGRMVSADPTIPDPTYSQAFNRYAYVYNNPLSATDPSGYAGEPATDSHGVYQCFAGCGKNQIIVVGGTNIKQTPINGIVSDLASPTPDNDAQVDTGTTSVSDPALVSLLPPLTETPLQQVAPPQKTTTIAQDSAVHNSNNPDSGQNNNNLDNPGGDDGLFQSPGAKNMAGGGDGWNSAGGISMVGLGLAPTPPRTFEILSPKPNLGSGPTASQNHGTAPKFGCQAATAASCFDSVATAATPTLTVAGIVSGALEYGLPHIQSLSHSGLINVGKTTGPGLGLLSLGLDMNQLKTEWNNPDLNHPVLSIMKVMHTTLSVEMDYVGLRGGVPGFIASGVYSLLDLSISAGYDLVSGLYSQAEQAQAQQQINNSLAGSSQGLPSGGP